MISRVGHSPPLSSFYPGPDEKGGQGWSGVSGPAALNGAWTWSMDFFSPYFRFLFVLKKG